MSHRMFIKRLDRYLIGQFFIALAGSIIFMVGFFLISIFIDNLKYFIHPNVPINIVLLFVVSIIPEVIIQVLPAAALFATSYTFGNLNATNEIIAIYNGGTGFMRLTLPLIMTGIFLTIFSFFFFEFVAADSSHAAFELRKEIKRSTGSTLSYMYSRSEFFLFGNQNTVYYLERFNAHEKVMVKPAITRFDAKGMVIFQLLADEGRYNKLTDEWIFREAVVISFDRHLNFSEKKYKYFNLRLSDSPQSFMKSPRNVAMMRFKDALKFIEKKKRTGGNYRKYLVEFQWRFAFPFSIIIVILIGSVAGIYFRKAIIVLSFLLSVVISFGFYGLLAMGLAFGKSGQLNPVLAAWLANVLFLLLCILALWFKK
jgi:lipopolysaccharide export system permease protein